MASGFVILAVTWTLFKGVNGIACLSCKDGSADYVSDLSQCDHIQECESDQVCYVEKFLSERNPVSPKYRAGCRSVKECKLISCSNEVKEKIPTHTPHVGKRETDERTLCSECCYSDLCNVNGCNTSAIEPERVKYHKRCFSCSNIEPDDGSTCTEMIWCDQPSQVCSITADPVRRQYNLGCEEKSVCDTALRLHENSGVPLFLKCFDGYLQNFNPVSNHTATSVVDVLDCPTASVPLTATTKSTTPESTTRSTTKIKTTTLPTTKITPTHGPTISKISILTLASTTKTTQRPTTPQTTTKSTATKLTTTQSTTTPLTTTTKSTTKPLTKATQLTTTTTSKSTNKPQTTQPVTTPLATAIKPINTITAATQQQQTLTPTRPIKSTSFLPPPTITSTISTTTKAPLRADSTPSKPCLSNPCKHGGICKDLQGTFNCYCAPGYVGETCEEDHDECLYHRCQNGGLCTNTIGSFHCTCANGYTGPTCDVGYDGIVCLNCKDGSADYASDLSQCDHIQECESDQVCYVEKFILESDPVSPKYRAGCRSVKECKLISCSNEVTENIPTQTPHVAKGETDERTLCSECCYSDLCNINGCNTSALEPERVKYHKRCFSCSNIEPDDGSTCTDMIWCDQPSQVCSITADPVRRQYNLGCEEKSVCDTDLQLHENSGVPLFLKCFDGHLQNFNPVSNHTYTSIVDVLDCPTASATTMTAKPTTRSTTEIKTPTLTTTSITPTQGPTTSKTTFTTTTRESTTPSMPCLPNPCKHGGSCKDLPGTFNCFCAPGYVGKTCEEDHDECLYHGCQNGGHCTNTFGSFHCTCANGYTGSTCDVIYGCIDLPGFPCADMLKFGMCGDTNILSKCRNTCIWDLPGFPCGDMLKFGMCSNDGIKEKCKHTCGDCSSNPAISLIG